MDSPAETRRKADPCENPAEGLIRGNGGIDGAVGNSRRDGAVPPTRAEQTALERSDVRWIGADRVGDAARQNIAEKPETGPRARYSAELPGDAPFLAGEWPVAWKKTDCRGESGSRRSTAD